MKHFLFVTKSATAIALLLGLHGCSGEPSAANIEAAMRARFANAASMAKNTPFGGTIPAGMLPQLHGVKKIGCAAASQGTGYTCDVEVDATLPFAGRNKNVTQLHLVKGSDGWVAAQ